MSASFDRALYRAVLATAIKDLSETSPTKRKLEVTSWVNSSKDFSEVCRYADVDGDVMKGVFNSIILLEPEQRLPVIKSVLVMLEIE